MSMTAQIPTTQRGRSVTADELRKVYDSVAANRQAEAHGAGFDTVHGDAMLAVARHVAQAQRDSDEWHAEWPK